MTALLNHAVAAARALPAVVQDDTARFVLRLVGLDDTPPAALATEDRAALGASKAAVARGAFATDEEVRAV